MLSVHEATTAILSNVGRMPVEYVALGEALGQTLAEDIVNDLDSPPFDKALMDGFAVRSVDLVGGRANLHVIDEVLAGQVSRHPVRRGEAIRIMTGAPLPEGADLVVPVEHTRMPGREEDSAAVIIETTAVAAGRNVMKQGESIRKGACVLPAGRKIRAQEIGCLAELGKGTIAVYARPRVAVLATGDELVSIDETPGPGQIRNSNEAMLTAQIRQMGAVPVPLGVARDDRGELIERITRGLTCDMLLLSGGVSAGKLDLVPAALAEAGVRQVFHKVQVKPGQPVWFGIRERRPEPAPGKEGGDFNGGNVSQPAPCYVFGLPGNPVSSMVCCEMFVRTAIRRLLGIEPAFPESFPAKLARDFSSRGNRPTYHPARWEWTEAGVVVEPVQWAGSADLNATLGANALALFPEGNRTYPAGTMVDVFLW